MQSFTHRVGLLGLLLTFLYLPLCATTFYVRTDGNDANDGLADNAGRALRTIQAGVNKMSGGDELIVGNGTYSTDKLIYIDGKSGTASRRTVIRAKNRWGAKIRTSNLYGAIEIRNTNYITVANFDVGHQFPGDASRNQGSGIQSFDSDYVIFKDNYVHDCGCGGISFREGDYATIERNVTRDNSKNSRYNCSGISVYQPEQLDNNGGYHIIIRRNVSFENECTLPFDVGAGNFAKPTDGNGIILDDFQNTQRSGYAPYKAKTLVENNLTFNNGGAGIKVYEVDNATIRHNTAYHNNRILKDYSGTPADIAITYSPGIFEVYNNVSVARDDDACSALQYINTPGFGYMNRQSNLLVGDVKMPSDNSKWGASNDLVQGRSNQSYAGFANATTSIGSFGSINDFDQYFRLTGSSPGANSGNDTYKANDDLEGVSRPQGAKVERGCYEGTTGTTTPPPTTTTNDWVYRDNLSSGWLNYSYDGNVTLQDGGIKQAGSYSAKFYSQQSWGTLSFYTTTARPGTNLQSIRFYARKWTDNAGYTARFRVRTNLDNALAYTSFTPTNTFQEFTITKAQLGSPGSIQRLDWTVPAGQTLFVDEVRFVYQSSSGAAVTQAMPGTRSVEWAEEASLAVYPNPSQGDFTVRLLSVTDLEGVELRLTDLTGRCVDRLTVNLLAGENSLHYALAANRLPAGVYLLTATHAEGLAVQQRITLR